MRRFDGRLLRWGRPTRIYLVATIALGSTRALLVVAQAWLLATIAFGLAFLGIKAIEYYEKFVHHHVPGPNFHWDGLYAKPAEQFYSLYFAMTGLHALHMIIGIGIMIVITVMALKNIFDEEYYTPVEVAGLYWHFVDIVWIFLFPLLYLIGGHYKGA